MSNISRIYRFYNLGFLETSSRPGVLNLKPFIFRYLNFSLLRSFNLLLYGMNCSKELLKGTLMPNSIR